MLKLAGVKTEAAFYKKYPTQEAFMKVHGKAFKKAQIGTYIGGETAAPVKPINYGDLYDKSDMFITGTTNKLRQEEANKQAALAADQKVASGNSGDMFSQISGSLGQLGELFGGEAEYGAYIPKARYGKGNMPFERFDAKNYSVPSSIGFTPKSTSLTSSGFQMPNAAQSFAQNNPLPAGVPNIGTPQSSTMDKIGGAIGKYAGPAGQVLQGLSALKAEKKAVRNAQQMQGVSDVSLLASQTRPEQTQRKYVRPEDMVTSGNQLFPTQGAGTNVLGKNGKNIRKAKGGAEIQNTYAPNDLYDDLGYEQLEDSTQVKQYQNGGFPWDTAGNIGANIGGAIVGQDAGSAMGGTIGGTLGTAIGGPIGGAIGKTLGTVAGGLLDTNDKKLKRAQAATQKNMETMALGQGAQSIQAQNASVMEDGGYVSNDWTPQVITKFGDHSPEDVYDFAHEGMDSLRAGGHLRSYRDPSEEAMKSYAMGGELKTHWGGHMEEMSENPYLPDGGVTYMPHGQSHDESDGNGRTGIGITYGDNPVEVERREPIMKLKDGSTGEDNLVVFGNLEIPKYGVEILGDKKAKGMKFKNYVSDLSKSETKQNKTIQKSAEELADFTPRTSFDKLKFAGLQANILGGNMKLKEIADTKQKAAALQNAINDAAEEFGLDADSLAKGKVKTAKTGGQFTKAQGGYNEDKINDGGELKEIVITKPNKRFPKPELPTDIEIPEHLYNPYAKDDIRPLSDEALNYVSKIKNTNKLSPKTPSKDYSWIEALNSIIPNFRPSDAEGLNANQLLGEMYALSSNQEEPVQAQQYSPELASPYSISLQDQMNEITAQTRAAQRMAQGNTAAQAMIAAQAYEAINKVKGEEFRMNQGIANQIQAGNIATMNDAKLKNLGILDQQYARQAQAKSNTKAITQAALNSISDKFAKNALENRTLRTYENMYNYRYDDAGRLINMNPLQQFNIPLVGTTSKPKDASGDDLLPIYNSKGEITGYKVKQDTKSKTKAAKNGSIVKAMRNL